MKNKETVPPEVLQQFQELLAKRERYVEQERNVERDWNQVTSVSLCLKFPPKESAIGEGRVELIGRKEAFFKLDRFVVFIYSADSTLMADTDHKAMLHYGEFGGPTFEFPFWCIKDWQNGVYDMMIHDNDDGSMLVIEFFLGYDTYPSRSYVCRDNETEEVDVRFHLQIK